MHRTGAEYCVVCGVWCNALPMQDRLVISFALHDGRVDLIVGMPSNGCKRQGTAPRLASSSPALIWPMLAA